MGGWGGGGGWMGEIEEGEVVGWVGGRTYLSKDRGVRAAVGEGVRVEDKPLEIHALAPHILLIYEGERRL